MMQQLDMLQGDPREAFPSARLETQYMKVLGVMTFCGEVTLAEIARLAGCSEPSASARLRQMRARGWTVKRKLIAKGLFAYSAEPPIEVEREQD